MKKKLLLSSLLAFIALTGCSTKINLNEYRPKKVPLAENAPKNLKEIAKHGVKNIAAVEKFENDKSNIDVTDKVIAKLKNSNLIQDLRKITPDKENEFLLLAQTESKGNSNARYFLIKGKYIHSAVTDNGTYHPPMYDKKGRKIEDASYSYEVCTSISGEVDELPSKKIIFSKNVEECAHRNSFSRNEAIINGLIIDSINDAAESLVDEMKDVFAPKGYIIEIKENKDHELIGYINLGKNSGLKQNMTVYIYRIKRDSLGNKNLIKVGEGKVSDKLFQKTAWITVEYEEGYSPKLGDIVKPDVGPSFFDKALKFGKKTLNQISVY